MSSIRKIIAACALASTYAQQSNTTAAPTALEQCATQKGCNLSDMNCRAACVGVPNPTSSQVNATNNCVAACNQTNVQEYALCTQNCINNNFNQASTPTSNSSSSPSPSSSLSPGHAKNITGKNSTDITSSSSSALTTSPTYFAGTSGLLLGAALFAALSSV
ncbi:hypothetical protein DSO57_1002420 [Entomophthora muscae]|uniref:Uncharacterized protein n=1 Tax=Entomophthora muscae TaxID=34485 RepID=A0ACC2SAJ3_9FUNG|nr:hypothetical protein DSO57_1002420 [Entomophthora muscae]